MNINKILSQPATSEHRHSGHEAIMSGAARACPICQAFEIGRLKGIIERHVKALDRIRNYEITSALFDAERMKQIAYEARNPKAS